VIVENVYWYHLIGKESPDTDLYVNILEFKKLMLRGEGFRAMFSSCCMDIDLLNMKVES